MKQKILGLVFVLVCVVENPILAQKGQVYINLIDSITPLLIESHNVPGIAIAVFDDSELIYKKGLGWANIDAASVMKTSTHFNIGSISKMVTAVAIKKLAAEGKIDLDAPVDQYLTRWHLPSSIYDHEKITIRALLSHTAGISVHGYPGFPFPSELPSLEALLNGENGPSRENAMVVVEHEPQSKFQYSGGGYTLLQLLIEEVTGMSFESYMQHALFEPLGMSHSSFELHNRDLPKTAKPYDQDGIELPHEHFVAQAAAGLYTNLDDMVKLVQEFLRNDKILSEQAFQEMLIPVGENKGNYGLGFRVLNMGPISVVGHAGSNSGWESAVFMNFNSGSGLIMMTNGDNGKKMMQSILRSWGMLKFSPRKH